MATWLIGGQAFFGPDPKWSDLGEPPRSYAWFCPRCGEVWARCAIAGRPWMVWTRPCEKCPPSWSDDPAGALWLSWDRHNNEALPEPVLRREFALHLQHFERMI